MRSSFGVVPRSFYCTAEVDHFCLQILLLPVRVNQEKMTECTEGVPRSCGSAQGVLCVTHSTAGTAPAHTALGCSGHWHFALLSSTSAPTAADFTLLKCFEKSVMPSLLLSFSSASSSLFHCAFTGVFLFFKQTPKSTMPALSSHTQAGAEFWMEG